MIIFFRKFISVKHLSIRFTNSGEKKSQIKTQLDSPFQIHAIILSHEDNNKNNFYEPAEVLRGASLRRTTLTEVIFWNTKTIKNTIRNFSILSQ
jgi:hypothetical protein